MNVDELLASAKALEEVKRALTGEEAPQATNSNHPFKIGEKYFIRTVTMHLVGKLESVGDKELTLSGASWVADSGRFGNALKTGELSEVEPFCEDVIIGRGAIVDATIWGHDLPREVK